MLLDAASLYFRAFYGVPTSITAPDGTPINAVRGFLDMTSTLVTRFRPNRLVACLDEDWRPSWRVALVPSYKAHRVAGEPDEEEIPDELSPQVPVLLEVLAAFGIATVGAADYEADDVIGTLATRGPGPVDVVTGDRDLIQLIDDANGVRVLYTGRGVAKLEEMDAAAVRAKYGVEPSQYADFATLRGDPSDGLPGVAGIGEKTAAGLLGRFGDLTGLLAAVDARNTALPASSWKRLDAAREYLAVAPDVVRVARDIAIPPVTDALPSTPVDPERVEALAERWGLESAVGRLTKALSGT
ncbi:5'-3' exonuclease H3TH domain-containing protein [Cryptosporangium arvum]|uniref:5'-3' exonuclease H3TH domain-containing protein n=1 Tax=Cryptosporangium arvum TaxID=80871 RepID=UPI00055F96DE